MNRILEIREDLISGSEDLSNILRKAMVLAIEIELPELRDWVRRELNGYVDGDTIPSYRSMKPTNLGTFAGGWGRLNRNVRLPTFNLPEPVKQFAEHMEFYDGVAELQGMTEKTFNRPWPPEMVILSRDALPMEDGTVLIEANQPVPGYVVSGILGSIKNRLLDFILELDASDITPETVPPNRNKRAKSST